MTAMDDNISWANSYESGRRFNDSIKKDTTRRNYLACLKYFCEAVHKNPDELIAFKLEGLQNVATVKEFQAEDLVDDFLYHNPRCKGNPNNQNLHLNAIKTFFSATRGRSLTDDVGSKIEDADHKQRSPTLEDIVALDEAMTTDRDKAIVWFLESCPVRKGTLSKILREDLKPTGDKDVPYSIEIERDRLKGNYKGAKHVGFLHSYAAMKLEKYDAELEQVGIKITPKSPLFVCLRDTKTKTKEGKPIEVKKGDALVSLNHVFCDASLKAWGNLDKKRYSPHDIRDFLQSVMESPDVGLNANMIKPFLSHSVGGTDGHYSSHKDKTGKANIAEYLKAFKKVLPFIIPKTVQQVEAELVDSNKTIATQQKTLTEQEQQIGENKKDMDEIKQQFALLKSIVERANKLDDSPKNIQGKE